MDASSPFGRLQTAELPFLFLGNELRPAARRGLGNANKRLVPFRQFEVHSPHTNVGGIPRSGPFSSCSHAKIIEIGIRTPFPRSLSRILGKRCEALVQEWVIMEAFGHLFEASCIFEPLFR